MVLVFLLTVAYTGRAVLVVLTCYMIFLTHIVQYNLTVVLVFLLTVAYTGRAALVVLVLACYMLIELVNGSGYW